ncbi:MAG: hypothetical protein CL748_00755 [Chloroflexi bacterium]|nr:hypothetical protein [Chloroflexota bacterium]
MHIINFNKSYTKKLYNFIKNSEPHGYIDWVFEYNYFENYVNESPKNIILIFSDLSLQNISGYCLVENKETLGFTQLNFSLIDKNYSNITKIINFLRKNSIITNNKIIITSNEKEKNLVSSLSKKGWRKIRKFYKLVKTPNDSFMTNKIKNFVINKISEKDSEQLTNLQNKAFNNHWGYEKNTCSKIRYEICQNHNKIFISRNNDYSILGYVWIKDLEKYRSKINMLGIEPNFEGNGLGKSLISYAIKNETKTGKKKIILDVDSENIKAQRLYGQLGFKKFQTLTWWEKKLF